MAGELIGRHPPLDRHGPDGQGAGGGRRPEAHAGQLPGTRVGLSDRALLLLGFAGAFRRSELVALDVADLEFSSAGLAVTLRKSKTDQEGRSRRIGIPYGSSDKTCPVRSLQAWLETARIVDGAVFRSLDKFQRVQPKRLSDKAVARIVKRRAAAVGLDPGSLRRTFAARRPGHQRRRRRCLRTGDHEPDRAPLDDAWCGATSAKRTCLPRITRPVWRVCK